MASGIDLLSIITFPQNVKLFFQDMTHLKTVGTQDALSSVFEGNFEKPWGFLKSYVIRCGSGYLLKRQGCRILKRCEENATVSQVLIFSFVKPLSFFVPYQTTDGVMFFRSTLAVCHGGLD